MDQRYRRKARRNDRLARWVITLGGMAIIGTVILILLLIVDVTLPLFQSPRTVLTSRVNLDAAAIQGVGLDEYGETAYALGADGLFRFVHLEDGRPLGTLPVTPSDGPVLLRHVENFGNLQHGLHWENGELTLVRVVFSPRYDAADDNRRTIVHRLEEQARFPAPDEDSALSVARAGDEGRVRVDLTANGRLVVTQTFVEESLFGDAEEETFLETLDDPLPGRITVLTLDGEGRHLFAGTSNGFLLRWDLGEPGEAELFDKIRTNDDGAAITALALVLGDVSVAVGDAAGRLSTWSPVREKEDSSRFVLRPIHPLASHPSAVLSIRPSQRDKTLVSLSALGGIHLDHMTSERHLARIDSPSPFAHYALSGRGDGLVAWSTEGRLSAWKIDNPHPEVSWKTLFGKVWYEGYDAPEWVWQSSAAGDDYEPKLSLTPLIFGTLKGTVYAMLFAVPLALFGAIYTSQFCRPRLRGLIKPTVEVMAAIPTVIIGFLAALWLAPIIEASLGSVFLSVVFVPAGLMLGLILWQPLRKLRPLQPLERGFEFLAAAPIVVIAVAAAFTAGPWFEQLFFGGDLKQWLFTDFGTRYDPRNCIVIAFGMGFAVIPIIFTIAEDSLSNVPPSLKAASLACGASRWQTVWRVILPSASPGIFAGTMIGFGRAVGETMIVLMATGNTPIMDWSIFNGMRPLSANIAVEIPEAPHGGTLYRVLFLSAVILFATTFVVNTVAEVVRQRLRRKYGRF